MKLQMHLKRPGCAEGRYTVKAKGFIIAILYWGDSDGMLSGWGSFAYVPIDPYGNGSFYFEGSRAIPDEATTVFARCIRSDFSGEESMIEPIPERFQPKDKQMERLIQLSFLSDMHLTSKPWRISRAFQQAESDTLFLLGDNANDGTAEQFEELKRCVEKIPESKAVLSVIGNHDCLHHNTAKGEDGTVNYAAFQSWLMERDAAKRLPVVFPSEDLEWSLRLGKLDIIGLQCVVSGRKFLFPEGRQVEWLKSHLNEYKDPAWHIILCHAPLLAHNPNRNEGNPYIDRNKEIQRIVNEIRNVIFLSGHTHVSPNTAEGSVEYDEDRRNIYINCGSVVITSLEREDGIMDPAWNDGCVTELAAGDDFIEIRMHSASTGLNFPRGYYRFCKQECGIKAL